MATGSARQYGHAVPASMPAAFVLQWALEVAAEAGWWGARHHGGVVDPLRDGLSFALHPGWHHPVEVLVRDAGPAPALVEDPLAAARAAYLVAGARLAAGQEGVRLGRHQRLAMVPDVWAMVDARRRAQPPPARDSCCFIYVLPGAHECAGCPRLRRAAR